MNLHKLYLTRNPCYKKADRIDCQGIMVHSTGCNNPYIHRYVAPDDGLIGEPSGSNWNKETATKCVHAFIGKLQDGSIATYNTLPYEYCAWHCGDEGNLTHIAFEMCEDDLKDEQYCKDVYREAVEFCAYLIRKHGVPNNIISHEEAAKLGIASNHADPMRWWKKYGFTMDKFREDVNAEVERQSDHSLIKKIIAFFLIGAAIIILITLLCGGV